MSTFYDENGEPVYVPTESELDSYARQQHGQLLLEFGEFATLARYPLSCWRVFRALLYIARGREIVITSVLRISKHSRHCLKTVRLALARMDRDGWVTVGRRKANDGWWTNSSYRLPRPQHPL